MWGYPNFIVKQRDFYRACAYCAIKWDFCRITPIVFRINTIFIAIGIYS